MKSNAATVEQYLASLPEARRVPVSTVRNFLLAHLDKAFQECMQYGVIGYCVPHSVWPHGHHTNPKLPLMYLGLSSQKNDMVVYMLFLHHNQPQREWFDKAWKASGRKNFLEVTGAGCCLRFKKLEDLSLEVIGEALRRNPPKKYLEAHVKMLERIGKGPDGKPPKTGTKEPASRVTARAKPAATKQKRTSGRAR